MLKVTEVTGCQAKSKDEYKRKRRPKRKCCGEKAVRISDTIQ